MEVRASIRPTLHTTLCQTAMNNLLSYHSVTTKLTIFKSYLLPAQTISHSHGKPVDRLDIVI